MLEPEIIYEDNHLLALVKPPGFLAQADGRPGRPDLLSWAEGYLARDKPGRAWVGLVHRLDLAAGGVTLLAKTSKAAGRLSASFRERRAVKIYLALVDGFPAGSHTNEGRLENQLVRDGDRTRLAAPGQAGTRAVLTWRKLFQAGDLDILEINLQTGFKHQIRAQLASAGWPIVGDTRYGGRGGPGPAIGLWARSLTVEHPTTKVAMTFQAAPGRFWPWTLLGEMEL